MCVCVSVCVCVCVWHAPVGLHGLPGSCICGIFIQIIAAVLNCESYFIFTGDTL